jgi:hypothetical protein
MVLTVLLWVTVNLGLKEQKVIFPLSEKVAIGKSDGFGKFQKV